VATEGKAGKNRASPDTSPGRLAADPVDYRGPEVIGMRNERLGSVRRRWLLIVVAAIFI